MINVLKEVSLRKRSFAWFLLFIPLLLFLKNKDLPMRRDTLVSPKIKGESITKIKPLSRKCEFGAAIKFKSYSQEVSDLYEIQRNIGYKNNKFGLYIYSTDEYINKAAGLVNSSGGDWGYVLIPYNVRDYDEGKWEKIFDLLIEEHLIPVIQLWDISLENYEQETKGAARFLSRFDWPIQKKYVSVYNEVNDSRFWGGKLDPEGYSKVLDFTINEFKSLDESFFILNGAFNATAPDASGYMDEERFLIKMNESVPGIFAKLDGWASHPYPQPAFRGKPWGSGRGSVRAYEWELDILQKRFGIADLPVFITETGWPHSEGASYNSSYYDAATVADYITYTFENVWLKDDRVVAIMPFTIYYESPYDHFSWIKKDGSVYPQFEAVQSIGKVAGKPPVIYDGEADIVRCL